MTNLYSTTALTPADVGYYDLGDIGDWTSPVLVKVYEGDKPFTLEQLENWNEAEHVHVGYVLVKDIRPQKGGRKALWKMPAGHRKPKEQEGWEYDRTPRHTALHETQSETGMRQILLEALVYVDKYLYWKGDHWKCVFVARITRADLVKMHGNDPENEGVEPKFFTVKEFYDLVYSREVLPEHYQKLVEFGVILSLDDYDAHQEEVN